MFFENIANNSRIDCHFGATATQQEKCRQLVRGRMGMARVQTGPVIIQPAIASSQRGSGMSEPLS